MACDGECCGGLSVGGEVLEAAGDGGGELVAVQSAGEDEDFGVVQGQGSGTEVAVAGGCADGREGGSGGVVGVGGPGGAQLPERLPVRPVDSPAPAGYEGIADGEEGIEVTAWPAVSE